MTNETKTRRAVETVALLAGIALILVVPVTRVAIFETFGAFRDWIAMLPGAVFGGLENVWNWIF